MCNIFTILIVLLAIITVGILVLGTIIIVSTVRHRRELEKLTRYQINITADIDRRIPDILSLMIQECFDDYKIKILVPLDEGFINSEREDAIRRDLTSIVAARMSPSMLDKLSLYYNIVNIDKVLADKIYITTMDYVVNHNKLK